jgi:hypothetical protein
MSRFFAYDPNQAYLLPPNVKDVLGNEHLSFRLHAMVEQLEVSRFEAAYAAEGRMAYPPRMMLKVWLYAFCLGVHSTRMPSANLALIASSHSSSSRQEFRNSLLRPPPSGAGFWSSACGRMRKSAHGRLPGLPRPPQVVLRLHIHPQLRGGAQGGRQPDGHGGGDSRLAVEHARERHTRDPQMGRCRGHGQVSQIFAENSPGWGGLCMRINGSWLLYRP